MPPSRPTGLQRRLIDRAYRQEIESGPLWGYRPDAVSSHWDTLGAVVSQHWDPVLEGRPGALLALATSLRSLLLHDPESPVLNQLAADASAMAARVGLPSAANNDIAAVIVDGRCLQHPDFAHRGIGRLATSVVGSLAAASRIAVTVVSDPDLPALRTTSLPAAVQITSLDGLSHIDVSSSSIAFLDPAPMTHRPSKLDQHPLTREATRIAVTHDYVPAHAPNIYLPTSADRLDYLIRLGRLQTFDQLWCNSEAIALESHQLLGVDPASITVLPPPRTDTNGEQVRPEAVAGTFVFAPVGADRRKNLPGAVSTLAHLAAQGWAGSLVILSHMPDPHRLELNLLAQASGLDHDRIVVVSDLTDNELAWLFANAEVALVPSFDEGLSIPVLEAVDAGCPVVASDIPPHRELLGASEPLIVPDDPRSFADQIQLVLSNPQRTIRRQATAIAAARTRHPFDDVLASLRVI